jgi:uncharacterized lipoprotein YmbA
MRSKSASTVLGLGLAAACISAACSLNPQEDPTRYYVLAELSDDPGLYEAAGLSGDTREAAKQSAGPAVPVGVGVGPVTLPTYLKRSRMATRVSPTEVEFMETERWAQQLDEGFAYTVAQNVAFLLGSESAMLHPWYVTQAPDFAVRIDVASFERDPTGSVRLVAQWQVTDVEGRVLETEGADIREGASDASVAASVWAQSAALARLSRQIADAIRRADS